MTDRLVGKGETVELGCVSSFEREDANGGGVEHDAMACRLWTNAFVRGKY